MGVVVVRSRDRWLSARFGRRLVRRAGVRLGVLVVLGAASTLIAPAAATASAPFSWTTYGGDAARTNHNAAEVTIGTGNVGTLAVQWSVPLDGPAMDEPAYAAGVDVDGTPTDVVYIATEHGEVLAVDAADGSVIWQRTLGTQTVPACHFTPDGIYGISGTPVLDVANSRLFVVDGAGKLYALDMATGATLPGWPITATSTPGRLHDYSGSTLWNGKLYLAFASYCDLTPYRGFVSEVDVAQRKTIHKFFPDGSGGPYGGGVWSYGGASVATSTGNVYVATGNAITTPEYYRYADHVVRLSSSLSVQASNYPGLSGDDVDFGSTPVLYQRSGCHPQMVVENKDGYLFVYNRQSPSAIDNGPFQRIHIAGVKGDANLIGVPAYDPARNMVFVADSKNGPSPYVRGIDAFTVGTDCKLHAAWQGEAATGGASADPFVANGVVYFAATNGVVSAYDEGTGALLWTSGSTIGRFVAASPLVANGVLYVATYGTGSDAVLYAFSPAS